MRVVMLHLQKRDLLPVRPVAGILRGEVVRMQVADQRLRPNIKHPLKVSDLSFIVLQGLQILQVPDVLAEEGMLSFPEAEAGLLLRTAGQQMLLLRRDCHRLRHIAARSPGKILMPVKYPAERIITARLNQAVVEQISVRNPFQRLHCALVVLQDRRIREICACHHQHVDVIPE